MKKSNKNRATVKEAFPIIIRIVKDTRPILPQLIIAALISLASVLLAMAAPEIVGELTNTIYLACEEGLELKLPEFFGKTWLLALVYLLSSLAGILTMYIMNNAVSRHYSCRLRIDMSAKISKIPVSKIDGTPNGEIISRMTNDVSVMGGSVHDIFNIIINGFIKLAVISVIIFISNPIMAAALIVFVPASMLISSYLASKSEAHFIKSSEARGVLYSLTEENLSGFETVKAFNAQRRRQGEFERAADDYRKKTEKAYLTSGTIEPIVSAINSLSYIIIAIIGGALAIRGLGDVGDLVSFLLYSKLFVGPLESIANGMSMMQSTIASAKRVYEFLDDEEMAETEPTGALPSPRGEVRFENVFFSYTKDKPLIENLTLDVKPGEKIAIVGPTGGGKTTIVNLLMRFYDVDSGRILVDGIDTSTMAREEVRNIFGMVLQDTRLFSGTVFENIAYGRENATREEVSQAAKRAYIDKFIESLPDGYDSVINEESTNISQGQKQLLTIARAYLSKRPILILDEATSNVDTRTELLIQETMDKLMAGRTSFVIAHRLSTIENADKIIVVDSGHVVECGTHTELLASGGLYSKIHKSQYMA